VEKIETLEDWLCDIALRLNIEGYLNTPHLPIKIEVVKKEGNEGLLALAIRLSKEIVVCLREDVLEEDENFIKACLIHELTHIHYYRTLENHSKRFLKRSLRIARFLKWESEELGNKVAELALRAYLIKRDKHD